MECLRWGILGLGVPNGRKIAVAMERSRNSVLLAVAGAEVAEWCDEEELEAVTQYTTYEELLCDPRVDAVYVGVCTRLRSAWCVRAAESGKHLLVEKPLARSAREAFEIVKACEEQGVLLMDVTAFVHHERSRNMVSALRDERHFGGPPTRCEASHSFAATRDFQQGTMDSVNNDDPLGVVGDLGWYCAKWGLLAFGADATPVSAQAKAVWWGMLSADDDGLDAVDVLEECPPIELTGTVDFGAHQTLQIHCSYNHAFRQRIEVSGYDTKLLTCDDFLYPTKIPGATFDVCTFASPPLRDLDSLVLKTAQTYVSHSTKDQTTSMIDAFADLVLNTTDSRRKKKQRFHAWARGALVTQVIVNALLESAKRDGRSVKAQMPSYPLVLENDDDDELIVPSQKTSRSQQKAAGGGSAKNNKKKKKTLNIKRKTTTTPREHHLSSSDGNASAGNDRVVVGQGPQRSSARIKKRARSDNNKLHSDFLEYS